MYSTASANWAKVKTYASAEIQSVYSTASANWAKVKTYASAEIQSVYSTASANWAKVKTYASAEIQSVYSIASADWAKVKTYASAEIQSVYSIASANWTRHICERKTYNNQLRVASADIKKKASQDYHEFLSENSVLSPWLDKNNDIWFEFRVFLLQD